MTHHRSRRSTVRLFCCLVVTCTSSVQAQNDSDPSPDVPTHLSYQDLILHEKPVAYWDFTKLVQKTTDETPAWTHPVSVHGKLGSSQAGPSDENSPLLSEKNPALKLDGKSYLVIADPGEKSVFDFTNGDTFSFEAWVKPTKISGGQYCYLIGKGRTGNKGVASDNHNWAVRLSGEGGAARIGFLFRDTRNKTGDHWHRWKSDVGFAPNSGWHHIAFTYTFGEPKSIKGWVDGYPTDGVWDMGKTTTVAPVVDNDEIWIGSSMGGNPGSSFTGELDEMALYRTPLTTEQVELRCPPEPEATPIADSDLPPGQVLVQIHEGIPDVKSWAFRVPQASDQYLTNWLTFPEIPKAYSSRAIQVDRTNPLLLRAHCLLNLPVGEHRLLLRSLNGARVFANGTELVKTPFHTISGTAHGHLRRVAKVDSPTIRQLQTGENEELATISSDGSPIRITMEVFVGGGTKRPETGEVSLSVETAPGQFEVLGPETRIALTDRGWFEFLKSHRQYIRNLNSERRLLAGIEEEQFWNKRHDTARKWVLKNETSPHPANSSAVIDKLIAADLKESGKKMQPTIDDWSFLRRVTLDVIGTVPTPTQIQEFQLDTSSERRANYIERLLASPGWADHWVGYWQDVLAENPNIVNPTLNNTGPFRWWIYESFLDNKPIDRFVADVVKMEGSLHYGGPAGFEMASSNDVPMAAKAHIVGTAFLGVQMKCARCHDAPFHDVLQRDLFALAAMLGRKEQQVPKTSSINLPEEDLKSLVVAVTLKPGEKIPVEWTFGKLSDPKQVAKIFPLEGDSREKLASLITAPSNVRFRKVIVNRLWQRYLGRGLVEPVDDWEFVDPSHEAVLEYLARELVLSGYDLKQIARLILNSRVYQSETVPDSFVVSGETFQFAGPVRRRLSAEQLVDSLFAASGKDLHAGQMNIDVDGSRDHKSSLNLGRPERAWQFTSTSNERDRPSLALPLAQDFLALMETLGWRSARQDPLTTRDVTPTVLQPAILANGVVGRRFTRLSEDSVFTEMALESQAVETLIDRVFQRTLTRPASLEEIAIFKELLEEGYAGRVIDVPEDQIEYYYPQTTLVSWSNHLDPEANEVKVAQEGEVRRGDPPTKRLKEDWRERMEDMLWTILNTPEMIVVP